MQPIVDGLETKYREVMTFTYLNANTDGSSIYKSLNLRGHPAFVIFQVNGEEKYRTLGYQSEDVLIEAIEQIIQSD